MVQVGRGSESLASFFFVLPGMPNGAMNSESPFEDGEGRVYTAVAPDVRVDIYYFLARLHAAEWKRDQMTAKEYGDRTPTG